MPEYKTPDTHIEEISKLPTSVSPVETAIPAFIGYTEFAEDQHGNSLTNIPKRITSLLEFEMFFGKAFPEDFLVAVEQRGTDIEITIESRPITPKKYLYYSLQLFYVNGGGPCYVMSVGNLATKVSNINFTQAFTILEKIDEPTLIVYPDACLLPTNDMYCSVINDALKHCNKMRDRFTIIDIPNALPTKTDSNAHVTSNFRNKVSDDLEERKYGAAYFPYLNTNLNFYTTDENIKIQSLSVDGIVIPDINDLEISNSIIKKERPAIYSAVKAKISKEFLQLPPSGGVAGVYARIDNNRGVWKAPANVSLNNVIAPAVQITDELASSLSIDPHSGKSVNAIRHFSGRGTLVWGARTLAGNDNEYRYIPVCRFLIYAEESIKKSISKFVFEPNDSNTWIKVQSMIESFLMKMWREGALAGEKPEAAFFVRIGLNQTMSAQDILEGRMIAEIGLALIRPGEFIILRLIQKMPSS
jgi:phage tail sheath protein FI